MAFQIHDYEQVSLMVEALDAEGNPADAVITWATSDDVVASVADLGEGGALVTASPGAGGLGLATITATVLNEDGTVLTGTFVVEVVAGDAVVVNIIAGTPEPKA